MRQRLVLLKLPDHYVNYFLCDACVSNVPMWFN